MDKTQAIYIVELLELLLKSEPGAYHVWAQARDEFMLSHGNFGLKQLAEAEAALRVEFKIKEVK